MNDDGFSDDMVEQCDCCPWYCGTCGMEVDLFEPCPCQD